MPAPLAVLDANVLFPFQLRNFLLHVSVAGLFDPLWSGRIVDELSRALRDDARIPEPQRVRLVEEMRRVFPDAWGKGFEGAADGLPLPDEGDRHVVALAVHYEAEVIVTRNLPDFPADTLRPLGTEAVGPDEFVGRLWERDRNAVLDAAETHRRSLKRHPLSPTEYLVSLRSRAELPGTAARLEEAGFLRR